MRNLNSWIRSLLPLLALVIAPLAVAQDAESPNARPQRLDLVALRGIPVFHEGRTKPFDSYANLAMESICHRSKGSIKLGFDDYRPEKSKDVPASAAALFPEGNNRSFSPAELVLSWMIMPQQWEEVPFIFAPHEKVREIIGVPKSNDRGLKLSFVSPKQIAESPTLAAYLEEAQTRRRQAGQMGGSTAPNEQDKLVLEVLDRYDEFRAISFNPRLPLTVDPIAMPGSRSVFVRYASEAIQLISGSEGQRSFGSTLAGIADLADKSGGNPISTRAGETLAALENVRGIVTPMFNRTSKAEGVTLEKASAAVEKLFTAVSGLEELLQTQKEGLYEQLKNPAAKSNESLAKIVRELAANSKELLRLTQEMRVALYDEGKGLMVVPSLNVVSLSAKRDTTNTSQPWLSLHAVLLSDGLTSQFPQGDLKKVRSSWETFSQQAALAFEGKEAPKLAESQQSFVSSLRALGGDIEPIRDELIHKTLKDDELDLDLVKYTAYPAPEVTARELHYNTLSPFFWSWCISLGACVAFSLAMGPFKNFMFWLGATIFLGGILFTGYGFYLRVAITGWAPVTNMYETVIFVPYVVAILGLWFLLLPMLWPGISNAWRLTAFPLTWEAGELTREQHAKFSDSAWSFAGMLLAIPRLLLMAYLYWFLAIAQGYGDGHQTILKVMPPASLIQGFTSNTLNDVLVWLVSLSCLILSVWFVPRMALTGLASIVFIPWSWATENLSEMLAETQRRTWFGWAAAAFAAFGTCVAWYSPPDILNKNFSPLQPVLRSNFWLTIHVLTIVASYGAGFLALILGNISIGYLIFGKYRAPAHSGLASMKGMGAGGGGAAVMSVGGLPEIDSRPRPPEAFNEVAQYCYRAIQVAVLLLVAGTILGGVWADVSWGRFWGWDPKEVWALISALVYLAILHGRYAGWFNNVGLVFGTVLGASMIIFSWYGVNFILPMFADGGSVGLHSYGSGSGGIRFVTIFVLANWVWLGLGLIRFQMR